MTTQVLLTLDDIGVLAKTAERNGTRDAFVQVAMQWADKANQELERLRNALAESGRECDRLRTVIKPFADLMHSTSGRIPTERLSFSDWHNLVKVYESYPDRRVEPS